MDQHSRDTFNMMKAAFLKEAEEKKQAYNQKLEARLNELSNQWGGRLTEQQRTAEIKKFESQNLPELKQTVANLEKQRFVDYGESMEKAEKFFTAYELESNKAFNSASKPREMTESEKKEQQKEQLREQLRQNRQQDKEKDRGR